MAEKDICSCREGANTFELLEVLYNNYLVRIFFLKIKTGRFWQTPTLSIKFILNMIFNMLLTFIGLNRAFVNFLLLILKINKYRNFRAFLEHNFALRNKGKQIMFVNNTWVTNPGLFDGSLKSLIGILPGRKLNDFDFVMKTLTISNLKKTSMDEEYKTNWLKSLDSKCLHRSVRDLVDQNEGNSLLTDALNAEDNFNYNKPLIINNVMVGQKKSTTVLLEKNGIIHSESEPKKILPFLQKANSLNYKHEYFSEKFNNQLEYYKEENMILKIKLTTYGFTESEANSIIKFNEDWFSQHYVNANFYNFDINTLKTLYDEQNNN